jgi:CheY-like chemotaxis protein
MDKLRKKLNVLLADDDPNDQKRFEAALMQSGRPVKIQSVYNGLKLIDYLKELNSVKKLSMPDLIITDLYMPFAGGLQVLKQIRRESAYQQIPIYVFSANFDFATQKNMREFGATGFYRKPAEQTELQGLINGILQVHETLPVS